MAISCNNIKDLIGLLRQNGDKILDTSSKLSLSATLLYKFNSSLAAILKHRKCLYNRNFYAPETNNCDMEFLYDFIQKTLALKLLPDTSFWNNEKLLDIQMFRNLKLLEIQRLSLNLIKGLNSLRAQLQYITCVHSVRTLGEVLENCGADNSRGFVWSELKEAVFSYNSLDSLDGSLEFTPCLRTLDLSHNRIQNAQLLNCLPNLKYFNISYNQLESVPTFSGQLCTQLSVLVLSNNFIEDIREIAVLINLRELDLSNNCLLEHSNLAPLINLAMLSCLNLAGNPLSFHPRHRVNTVYFLHPNTRYFDFILEKSVLSKTEKQFVRPSNINYSWTCHLDSACSTENECAVKASKHRTLSIGDTGVSSDMDTTSTSSLTTVKSEKLDNTFVQDSNCMQDSGIVAGGQRPISPSEFSIGSATSLDSNLPDKRCDSDIEVLSNPSQSSIEVIGCGSGNLRSYAKSEVDIHRDSL